MSIAKLCCGLGTTTAQKFEVGPSRARIEGSWTCVSLNSRLEGNKEVDEPWFRVLCLGTSGLMGRGSNLI